MNHIYYIPETDMLILTRHNFGDGVSESMTYVYIGEL